jgi:hypothetical protein
MHIIYDYWSYTFVPGPIRYPPFMNVNDSVWLIPGTYVE